MIAKHLVPQADVPRRVIDLVESAVRGTAPDLDDRDLKYYQQAGRILGFLDEANSPTAAGYALVALPSPARLARFALAFEWSDCGKALIQFAGVPSLLDVPSDRVEPFLRTNTELAESTTHRRKTSLRAYLAVAKQHHPARRDVLEELPWQPLEDALAGAVFDRAGSGRLVQRLCNGTRHLRVATAYVTVQGYDAVARRLDESVFRLLVGSEDAVRSIPDVLDYLRRHIERGPATDEKRRSIHKLREELIAGTARVRMFNAKYLERLHAKVYLFDARAAYITSANLTHSGLWSNIEGGELVDQRDKVEYHLQKFDEFFDKGVDLLPQLVETLEQTWAFQPPVAPYLLYLRVLKDIFGSVPDLPDVEIQLADYQRMVVGSILQVLRDEHGGLLIAPTGTGKTVMAAYTAAALFFKPIMRVIVVCPNESLASRWEQDFTYFGRTCLTVTHGIVQGKGAQTGDSIKAKRLESLLDKTRKTDLIIVDEAHAFRNPKTTGYQNLKRLLAGSPEHGKPMSLLLTATPMSTGLTDLNALLGLIGKEQLHSVQDIARSRTTVNITRPFIEDYFGKAKTEGGPRLLRFGYEMRSFARVRFRKAVYPFTIEPLIEAIQAESFLMSRRKKATERSKDQLALPGLHVAVRSTTTTYDVSVLIRLLLMRAAESSPRAISRMLDRLAANPSALPVDDEALGDRLAEVHRLVPDVDSDTKLQFLVERLRAIPPDQKVLVFTWYVSTAEYLFEELGKRLRDRQFGILSGKTRDGSRKSILERFAPKAQGRKGRPRKDDIQVLIATDAIAEGENLQDAVVLINYDLHWTPLRLIQRVGRVDRPTTYPREVEVLNFYPEGDLFEELLSLWDRLKGRSALYDQLAKTSVLEEEDPSLSEAREQDYGLVRGIYEEENYEKLLREYLPTSTHLVHYAKATKEQLDAANALPANFRSVLRGTSAGTFALIKHGEKPYCVTDALPQTDGIAVSPNEVAHEAIIPLIACDPETVAPPEPAGTAEAVRRLVSAWANRNGVEPDDVEVICSETILPSSGSGC